MYFVFEVLMIKGVTPQKSPPIIEDRVDGCLVFFYKLFFLWDGPGRRGVDDDPRRGIIGEREEVVVHFACVGFRGVRGAEEVSMVAGVFEARGNVGNEFGVVELANDVDFGVGLEPGFFQNLVYRMMAFCSAFLFPFCFFAHENFTLTQTKFTCCFN